MQCILMSTTRIDARTCTWAWTRKRSTQPQYPRYWTLTGFSTSPSIQYVASWSAPRAGINTGKCYQVYSPKLSPHHRYVQTHHTTGGTTLGTICKLGWLIHQGNAYLRKAECLMIPAYSVVFSPGEQAIAVNWLFSVIQFLLHMNQFIFFNLSPETNTNGRTYIRMILQVQVSGELSWPLSTSCSKADS